MSAQTTLSTVSTPLLNPVQRRAKLLHNIRQASVYVVAISLAIWILLPMWLIATMALSTPQNVRTFPKPFFPNPASLETISFFINSQGIPQAAFNSVLVAVITLVVSTLIAVPAGYAFARYLFPGRDLIRLGVLAVRAFPIVVLAVPLATIYIQLGIYDNPFSLALMHVALS